MHARMAYGPIRMAMQHRTICAVICIIIIISFSVHHLTRKSLNTTLEILLFHISIFGIIMYNFVFESWSRFLLISWFALFSAPFSTDSHTLHDFWFRNGGNEKELNWDLLQQNGNFSFLKLVIIFVFASFHQIHRMAHIIWYLVYRYCILMIVMCVFRSFEASLNLIAMWWDNRDKKPHYVQLFG